jgi:hypothetical protein
LDPGLLLHTPRCTYGASLCELFSGSFPKIPELYAWVRGGSGVGLGGADGPAAGFSASNGGWRCGFQPPPLGAAVGMASNQLPRQTAKSLGFMLYKTNSLVFGLNS